MKKDKDIRTNANTASMKMLRAMLVIGIACAVLIVFTREKTRPIIERNKAEALKKAIFQVIPNVVSYRTYMLNEHSLLVPDTAKEREKHQRIYAGYNDKSEFIGVAIEAEGMGYADVIRILYSYEPSKQRVTGYCVLATKETPGLGDKIEKDENFLSNFKQLDVLLNDDLKALVNNVITVKQSTKQHPWEIDGISGATISSRAIGAIMDASTKFWIPIVYQQKDKLRSTDTWQSDPQ
ncbi:MAG: FMN-binding protein [SAR324 cluster bacterium]|nr:FMN-binding protein [SAR324 cluster bacterium]